VVGWVGF